MGEAKAVHALALRVAAQRSHCTSHSKQAGAERAAIGKSVMDVGAAKI